ncbi:MAG: hypothetical protein N3G79_00505 [Sulfolobales archaeon]|nr:hypothetical protein [Sulfolobales archaeon]
MPLHVALRVVSLITVVVTQAPTRDYGHRVELSYAVVIILGIALALAGLLLGKRRSYSSRTLAPSFSTSKYSTK